MKHLRSILIAVTAAAVIGASAQSDFAGRLLVAPDWTHSKTSSVASVRESFSRILDQTHTYGSGTNQMNAVVQYSATLATNGAQTVYQLATGVINSFGDTVAFSRVNVLAVRSSASNRGDIHIGNASAAPFSAWISPTNGYAVIKPGGLLLLTAPDAAGYSTSPGAVRIANATTNPAAYQVWIGGAQ